MSTIQERIQYLADYYREPEYPNIPILTPMDLLASLALEKSMSHAGCELRCAFGQMDAYNHNPDVFIDSELGGRGTRQRIFYEIQAKELHRLAQEFRKSNEPAVLTHPYFQEERRIEERFKKCSPLLKGAYNMLSPQDEHVFKSELEACLTPRTPPLSGCSSKPVPAIQSDMREFGRSKFDPCFGRTSTVDLKCP